MIDQSFVQPTTGYEYSATPDKVQRSQPWGEQSHPPLRAVPSTTTSHDDSTAAITPAGPSVSGYITRKGRVESNKKVPRPSFSSQTASSKPQGIQKSKTSTKSGNRSFKLIEQLKSKPQGSAQATSTADADDYEHYSAPPSETHGEDDFMSFAHTEPDNSDNPQPRREHPNAHDWEDY